MGSLSFLGYFPSRLRHEQLRRFWLHLCLDANCLSNRFGESVEIKLQVLFINPVAEFPAINHKAKAFRCVSFFIAAFHEADALNFPLRELNAADVKLAPRHLNTEFYVHRLRPFTVARHAWVRQEFKSGLWQCPKAERFPFKVG